MSFETMTFRQLSQNVADKLELPRKQVLAVLREATNTIVTQSKKGNKVRVTGLGSFTKVKRAARMARNPQTGETFKTKAHGAVKFKASKQFKKTVY